MAGSQTSYLIIGAGIFGASTALHLKRAYPANKVVLVDRGGVPNPKAASHDLNEIVRADYADPFYMTLALEAMNQWREEDLYSKHYHQTGILIADSIGLGAGCLENYKSLGVNNDAIMLDADEACERFPALANGNWDGVTHCYLNLESGWADAVQSISSVLDVARELGVDSIDMSVATITLDHDGQCTGVSDAGGYHLTADKVLLYTGAYTPKVLADSFPNQPDNLVGDRVVAAGAVSCIVAVDKADTKNITNTPVFINAMDHTHGEAVPLNIDGRLKFNFELSFTNNTQHIASNSVISVPPPEQSKSMWSRDVPASLKSEASKAVIGTYGDILSNSEIENFRMCWDAVTPSQDWLICPHPRVSGLHIATGGSFHSWKFLPNIGKYITMMLHNESGDDFQQRWAWDKVDKDGSCPMYLPKRDLADLCC